MEPICQACGYQRKPTDQAPDWQCPSCGKAYAKTSQESPSPLVIYADDPAPESGNRLHGEPSYRREPKETARNKYGLLIGILFSLLLLGLPILVDPSSASVILLHSGFGFTAFIFIVLMAVLMTAVVAGRRMSARGDSIGPKSAFAILAAFFGIVFAVIFFAVAISGRNDARTEAKIRRNGLRAMADVVRVYTGGCGRAGCNIFVEYAFTPPAETKSVPGYAWIGAHDDDPHVAYARTHKQVPIAYEVGHPEVSALNFDDDVFRLDPGERSRHATGVLGMLLLGIFMTVLVVMALSLWLRPNEKSGAH